LVLLPGGSHWIVDEVLDREDCRAWLRRFSHEVRRERPEPLGIRPGEVPSRLQNALLDPFVFVRAISDKPQAAESFQARCREWQAFAKAMPRTREEEALNDEDLRAYNLFLFGEPETSPLIRTILERAGVVWTEDVWRLQEVEHPRAGHGLWLAVPSPFAAERTVVLQCGVAWGEGLPPNHFYDMIPDLLVYTPQAGRLGINEPVAAARVGDDGVFVWFEKH